MDREENRNEDKHPSNEPTNVMKIKRFHFLILMFLTVFITAALTTFVLSFGDDKVADNVHEARDRSEFTKLYQTFERINSRYFEDVPKDKLIEGAINGMVDAIGDPYSDYMTVEEAQSFNETISSSFEGIGAQIEEKDGYIVIVAPIKGSPAEKAGLMANDMILEVDGKSIQGMSSQEAVTLIRGEKGTEVELTIRRPGHAEQMRVKITRDVIPIETVYSEILDNSIGKIQITSFSEHTSDELKTHINELQEQGMKGLILDLRYNPGGLLPQAIEISNMFVPKGEVIYQMEYKDGSREKQLSNQNQSFDLPLVVVVDGGSASASEIVAAALQESAGVPIVGEKTFGKGTAQTNYGFIDGSSVKLTTAKWLTPSGKWINENGVTPDYEVPMPDYASLPYVDPELKLEENMLSDEVSTIEKMLDVLGYKPGKVDGLFDDDTKKAVLQFQNKNDLEETGIVTGETTLSIMEEIRNKLIEEDPQIKKAEEVLTKFIQSEKQ